MRQYWILCLISALLRECWAEERIIGGTDAALAEAPFMVSLRSGHFHMGGGSIIDNRWILTAQIILRGSLTVDSVVVGTTNLNGGIHYRIQKTILHDDYNDIDIKNDIALLKTEIPIEFNAYVQPIPLGIFPLVDGSTVKSYGWGTTTYLGAQSQTLKVLESKTISNNECASRFPTTGYRFRIVPSVMCELADPGTGPCSYDEGGPHVANGQLYGITSWIGSCAEGYPHVSTRISSHILWIVMTKLFNM